MEENYSVICYNCSAYFNFRAKPEIMETYAIVCPVCRDNGKEDITLEQYKCRTTE